MGSNPFSALEEIGETHLCIPRPHSAKKGTSRLAGRRWLARDIIFKDSSSFKFRIASYNVLAQCYAKPKHFSRCKPEHLRWEFRKKALIELLAELDADILCLQEVDNYDKFWLRELSKSGYLGTYKQRNSDSKLDGCATFYRASKFEVLKCVGLEFDHVDTCQGLEGAPEFATHNVALLTLLAPLGMPHCCFCVANLHLFWDPSFDGLKIAQAKAVVFAAQELAKSMAVPAPIILAGDFNSVPTSAVYAYLTEEAGFLSAYAACGNSLHSTSVSPNGLISSPPSLTFGKIVLSKGLNPHSPEFRPLGLALAMSPVSGHSLSPLSPPTTTLGPPAAASLASITAEPAFTNYRDIFHGTIDYIMVSSPPSTPVVIEVLRSLGMISSVEASKEGGGLPSSRHPSDHLPIAADLQLRTPTI